MARLTLQAEGYDVMEVDGGEVPDALLALLPAVLVLDEAALVRVAGKPAAPTVVLLSAASPLHVPRDTRDGGSATTFVPSPWSPLELTRAARRVRHAAPPAATRRSGCS